MAVLLPANGCRARSRSPRPIASTATPCAGRWRRWARTRFSEVVGAGGREPRGQLIGASEEPATRELARQLGLKTAAPLVRIEALRSADRTPICVGTTWLAAERFPEAGRIYERVRSTTKL